MKLTQEHWAKVDGKEVRLFRLENACGNSVELTNYGATVVSIKVRDNQGVIGDVILGFPTLAGYLQDTCYIGSTIGRFANRIANAKFTLDGTEYILEPNDNELHTNHSASAGFDNKVFDYSIAGETLIFSYFSKDMDGGFPGNLHSEVRYQWTENNELKIDFKAHSDRPTPVSFTNHCYFNLTGNMEKIFNHRLTVRASSIVEATDDHIPTGKIVNTGRLTFDHTVIADVMNTGKSRVKGLNACYVLEDYGHRKLQLAAVLSDQCSGRKLSISTTFPGLMLYTGTFLNSEVPGHQDVTYSAYDGICLECQYFPDSPNQPDFPSTILKPGKLFEEKIIYAFEVQ